MTPCWPPVDHARVPGLRQPLPINLVTAPPLYLQTQSSSASLAIAATIDSRRSSLVSGPESAEDAGLAVVSPNSASLLRGPTRRVRYRADNLAHRTSDKLTMLTPARPSNGACRAPPSAR